LLYATWTVGSFQAIDLGVSVAVCLATVKIAGVVNLSVSANAENGNPATMISGKSCIATMNYNTIEVGVGSGNKAHTSCGLRTRKEAHTMLFVNGGRQAQCSSFAEGHRGGLIECKPRGQRLLGNQRVTKE